MEIKQVPTRLKEEISALKRQKVLRLYFLAAAHPRYSAQKSAARTWQTPACTWSLRMLYVRYVQAQGPLTMAAGSICEYMSHMNPFVRSVIQLVNTSYTIMNNGDLEGDSFHISEFTYTHREQVAKLNTTTFSHSKFAKNSTKQYQ